jgi:hypothetical protein
VLHGMQVTMASYGDMGQRANTRCGTVPRQSG